MLSIYSDDIQGDGAMRILITGATSTVSRGMIPRLKAAGHEIVLHDLIRLPENDLFRNIPFVQGDIQA